MRVLLYRRARDTARAMSQENVEVVRRRLSVRGSAATAMDWLALDRIPRCSGPPDQPRGSVHRAETAYRGQAELRPTLVVTSTTTLWELRRRRPPRMRDRRRLRDRGALLSEPERLRAASGVRGRDRVDTATAVRGRGAA